MTEDVEARDTGKRVAIIGAGPGGLSAGLALHKQGFHVRVFERHNPMRALGGAILLNAVGIYILRSYGATVDDIETVDLSEFRRYDGRHRVTWKTDPDLIRRAGSSGWIAGTMRSEVYDRMLAVMPPEMLVKGANFSHYEETADGVTVYFEDGSSYDADLVIGADGVSSRVREQLWGNAKLKDVGVTVHLGWTELEGPPRSHMLIHHNDKFQFGFAPLRYQDKDCFEWWFVEKTKKNDRPHADPAGYVAKNIRRFAYPIPDLVKPVDSNDRLVRWVVKYKDPLKKWSKGRVTILGDAAHATSPYAGYGAGMAIEDGYFLGKFLSGRDLSDLEQVTEGLERYDSERVDYTNRVTEFAKTLGIVFHRVPWVVRRFRDFMLDHTKVPDKAINKGYTEDALLLLESILSEQDPVRER